MIDVELIDARHIDGRHRPGDAMFFYSLRQNLATIFGNQLRIAQTLNPILRIKYHRAGDHWSKQSATPDFIHSSDELSALASNQLLEFGACTSDV